VNGSDTAIVQFMEEAGFEVISTWAMGNTLEELTEAGKAHVNLVVSSTGLGVAKALKELFGTPYVIGTPIGSVYQEQLKQALHAAADVGEANHIFSELSAPEIAVIGESVTSLSLAQAIELTYQKGVKVLCTTECPNKLLRANDTLTFDEDDVIEALANIKTVIADPLYRPICPEHAKFIPLPAESFSGRLYRNEIPNLVSNFDTFAL
ncbi:MAG: oxidoreductase, partial [Lachnospiraceae bacterium]|nr:oxidoreductase [Lachnospiraceae bacterium]